MCIARLSPLYDYWHSDQDVEDERIRLLKLNLNEPASNLFRNEPYKWESLFQSVLRKLISGDESSIKGLMVLLSTITKEEKEITLAKLDNFLDKRLINILRNGKHVEVDSRKNLFSFLQILLIIFTNPYGLNLKKKKNHVYEKTGMFFYYLRKTLSFNK